MIPAVIKAEPLTGAAFRPFGDVIQEEGIAPKLINRGTTLRFNDLAQLEALDDGRIGVSLFRAPATVSFPCPIPLVECHPLGSQAFFPCEATSFLIVVHHPAHIPEVAGLRAFITNGRQGVNYARGVWHAPLLSFAPASYIVIDRIGPGSNLREYTFPQGAVTVDC
jgi:ureidoglycolate lyase